MNTGTCKLHTDLPEADGLNPEVSHCELMLLTTAPLCHLALIQLSSNQVVQCFKKHLTVRITHALHTHINSESCS